MAMALVRGKGRDVHGTLGKAASRKIDCSLDRTVESFGGTVKSDNAFYAKERNRRSRNFFGRLCC
jgi:hypothetical protein